MQKPQRFQIFRLLQLASRISPALIELNMSSAADCHSKGELDQVPDPESRVPRLSAAVQSLPVEILAAAHRWSRPLTAHEIQHATAHRREKLQRVEEGGVPWSAVHFAVEEGRNGSE